MDTVQTMRPGSILGHAVPRVEDARFLTGDGRYLDDLQLSGALHVAFVRSTVAHGGITRIDVAAAREMPGVAGVYTAENLGLPDVQLLGFTPATLPRPPLARDTVRFVGEAVAVVVAETRAQAADAAEAVMVDYDPLPAVVDVESALESDAPIIHPQHGSNIAMLFDFGRVPDVLEGADVVVKGRFVNQRLAPVPMEANGCAATPDPETGGLRVWCSTQGAYENRRVISEVLGLEPEKVRVIAPAVGGGFGSKGAAAVEQIVVAKLAQILGRPVTWFETRSENMVALGHGRAQIHDVELGATRDGTLVGLRATVTQDSGAYPLFGAFLPFLTRLMAVGVYRIPKAEVIGRSVNTNTTPVTAYRGAGRPEATAMIERAMDILADELGMDPAELRRRNLIPPDAFPHMTVTGAGYDVGDYEKALDEALRASGYETLRQEQGERRARGDRLQLGIGLSVYVEITGAGAFSEHASVEVHPDGSVTVVTGTSPHGQGHETSWAQIVADRLGVPMERIRVLHSDTALPASGTPTGGSRSAQIGGSAVYRMSEQVLDKARQLTAHLLEASPDDITVFNDGRVGVAGSPASAMDWGSLAVAASDTGKLPEGMEPGLRAEGDFDQGDGTFPFGAHVAVVEVDTETGAVRLARHVAVDDCGNILNPMIVDGQVHGGLAQGISQALYEAYVYDEDGNPLTGTLMDYAFPSAAEFPSFETRHTVTPTPLNPLGAKGIGESATIGSTPAVQNAVVDAVSHLGVRHIDMPLTAERVWSAIQQASGRA